MQAFKEWAKRFLEGLTSRKFLGFVVATALCFFGKLDSNSWVIVFGIFCAANVAESIGKPPSAQ